MRVHHHAGRKYDPQTRDRKSPRSSLFLYERVACEVQRTRAHWIAGAVC